MLTKSLKSLVVILGCSAAISLLAQTQPVGAEGHQWWQHAVFYEIYPRVSLTATTTASGISMALHQSSTI